MDGLSQVYDLLKKKAVLRVLEDGKNQVQVVGLQEDKVSNDQEVRTPAGFIERRRE